MAAAKDIGGDFYDFFRIDDDHIALVIADVCGKGIPAALFMAVSRTIIRSKGIQGYSAAECITESNHLLAAYSVDSMFVTVFYAIYNTKTGLVSYSNAGHNPPYLIKAGGTIEQLPLSKDIVVGALDDFQFSEETLQLEHGETLLLYTDGVTEAINVNDEEYGEKRLEETLKDVTQQNCQQIINTVKADVKTFAGEAEQSDDITLLAIKRL
jgi:sigma-B regulation protein RsbU (phosphoserine phosphatase)